MQVDFYLNNLKIVLSFNAKDITVYQKSQYINTLQSIIEKIKNKIVNIV
jgi:hypothetical protein